MKSRRLLVKSVILGKEAPLSLVKTPLFVVPSGTVSARTGGERKTACEGAFIFISLTVGSVSWWYVEVVPVS